MAEIVVIDVCGARQAGWSISRVGDVVFSFAVSQAPPVIAGWSLIELLDQWALGSGIIAAGIATWAWFVFVAPALHNNRLKAHGLSLSQIRAALAPLRSHHARFRGGWLALNLLAVAALVAVLALTPNAPEPLLVGPALLLALNGIRLWSDQGGLRQTASAYLLLAAIWTALAAIMVIVTTAFEHGEDGGVAGIALLASFFAAITLTGRVWARARISLDELRRRDPRPPILFLRSFEDEGWMEAQLRETLRPYGPFVAIGKPGELRPEGAARTYFEGNAWRPAILKLMDEASLIVAVPGLTSGLDWEMNRLAERGRYLKCAFLFLADNNEQRVSKLAAALRKTEHGAVIAERDSEFGAVAFAKPNGGWNTFEAIVTEGELQAALEVAMFAVLPFQRPAK